MLEIGQELYKDIGSGKIGKYVVIGIRICEQGTFYEIESTFCTHGYACTLLVNKVDKLNMYKYVQMTNDNDEEQYYWHDSADGNYYYTSKNQCKKRLVLKMIEFKSELVADLEKKLKVAKTDLEEFRNMLDTLN